MAVTVLMGRLFNCLVEEVGVFVEFDMFYKSFLLDPHSLLTFSLIFIFLKNPKLMLVELLSRSVYCYCRCDYTPDISILWSFPFICNDP